MYLQTIFLPLQSTGVHDMIRVGVNVKSGDGFDPITTSVQMYENIEHAGPLLKSRG